MGDYAKMGNSGLLLSEGMYCNVQGDTYRILYVREGFVFMILQLDEVRGVGPLHVTTIKLAREGLVDERKEEV